VRVGVEPHFARRQGGPSALVSYEGKGGGTPPPLRAACGVSPPLPELHDYRRIYTDGKTTGRLTPVTGADQPDGMPKRILEEAWTSEWKLPPRSVL
jgi:hypothetical protein